MNPAEAAIREALKDSNGLHRSLTLLALCNKETLAALLSELDALRARCEAGEALLRRVVTEGHNTDAIGPWLTEQIDAHLKGTSRE